MKHLGLVGSAASLAGIVVALVAIGRAQAAPTDAGSEAAPADTGGSQAATTDGGTRVFPDPSEITPPGMMAQMQEPATGFTGACLIDFMTYKPTLPLLCYSPNQGTGAQTAPSDAATRAAPTAQYGSGQTKVTFPAQKVFRSYGAMAPTYDSYQVLLTCYPPNPDGTCPFQSSAISHSCCDYGAIMTSLDARTASGFVNFGLQ
jgi:hypothetical protein